MSYYEYCVETLLVSMLRIYFFNKSNLECVFRNRSEVLMDERFYPVSLSLEIEKEGLHGRSEMGQHHHSL